MEHVVQTNIEYILRVTDQNNKPCDTDQDIKAMLKGARNHYTAKVEKNPNQKGIIRLLFCPQDTGFYDLIIDVGIAHLYQPGDATVKITEFRKAQETIDIKYEISGPALGGGTVNRETYLEINVTCYGKQHDIEHNTLLLTMGSGNNLHKFKPKRESIGLYRATFQFSTPGFYTINCYQDDKSILTKPLEPVHFISEADASQTVVIQAPKNMQAIGQRVNLIIQGKSKAGINLVQGGENFDVGITGPGQVTDLEIRDNGDGRYSLSFTPTASGYFELEISLNGKPIGNSPLKILAGRK